MKVSGKPGGIIVRSLGAITEIRELGHIVGYSHGAVSGPRELGDIAG